MRRKQAAIRYRVRARSRAGIVWAGEIAVLGMLAAGGCERLPTGPAASFPGQVRGVTFVDWSADGYSTRVAERALDELAATGANTIGFLVTAYQSHACAPRLRTDDPRTPTVASIRHATGRARDHGLRLLLKLHVDLDDGAWRGLISPPDPRAWFDSYREYVLPWAAFADSIGVEQLVLGTELAGTLGSEQLWRETIRNTRRVFGGELLYSASWDEVELVPFWDAVDYVGVNAYFPVGFHPNPVRFELLAGWQPWLERLERVHHRTGRRILFTEIGYRSVDGACQAPYSFDTAGRLDLGEQADLYWAALEATARQGWITGMYWWNWPADESGGPANTDYSPNGKPACLVLRNSWL